MGSSSMKIAAKGKETEVVMQWNSSDILARALSSKRYYFKAMPSRHDPDRFGNLLKMLLDPKGSVHKLKLNLLASKIVKLFVM